jgi:hypothetical protein
MDQIIVTGILANPMWSAPPQGHGPANSGHPGSRREA